MRTLRPDELLHAWESVQSRSPVERPAMLLAAFDPEFTPETCAHLPLGLRDSQLLALRERTLGAQLNCVADCPRCGSSVEFAVGSAALRSTVPVSESPLSLNHDGWVLSFRLPNTVDLVAVAGDRDPATARRSLFGRCLHSATAPDGRILDAAEVPDEVVRVVGECMAAADSGADPCFALDCAQCGAPWEAPFDAAGFFWQELSAWVARVLRDIHELASAYGWSEAEILALTPGRRRAYLDLIRT